jgi:hypothetical protein
LERIANQANGAYAQGWFDASAVMIRRLLETLIIEAFEKHGRAAEIQNRDGDFLYLRDMIAKTVACTAWNLSRNTKQALPRLKDVGDKSAHSRRFNAVRTISTPSRQTCGALQRNCCPWRACAESNK